MYLYINHRKGFNDLETTHKHLMNEWDYLNNLILGDPERIPNNTQLRFWWICKNNPEHRYRMAIVDKIANVKRSVEPCMFCKGRRRKREHFVPYRKI